MYAAPASEKIHFHVVWQAVAFPFLYLFEIIKLALIPFLLSWAISLFVFQLSWPDGLDFRNAADLQRALIEQWPATALLYLLNAGAVSVYAVGVHRMIIHRTRPPFLLKLTRHELAYFGAATLFAVIAALAKAALSLSYVLLGEKLGLAVEAMRSSGPENAPTLAWIAAVGSAIVLIAVALQISTRVILILPHAAITGRIAFKPSWQAMRGNVWPFIEVYIVYWIAVVALMVALIFAFNGAASHLTGLAMSLLAYAGASADSAEVQRAISIGAFAFAYVIVVTMNIALLSFIYRDLDVDWSDVPAHARYA